MIQQQVTMVTENAVMKSGKCALVGTKTDYKLTDDETGLVMNHSLFAPRAMRLVDRNKYDKPHQSTKQLKGKH
ncbi:MAG: hypothetical protein B7Y48_07670 [Methylophilales bacterium 28-44-11]|nr:MAG: hypothetical protein B7Y48_07670 [Methylophilales bacterium 28-44-11]